MGTRVIGCTLPDGYKHNYENMHEGHLKPGFMIEPKQYKKIVSVMIPTRNRMVPNYDPDFPQVGGLLNTLESIFQNTTSKEKVEIILRVDDDDKNTLDNLHLLDKYNDAFDLRVLKGPRYRGYIHMYRFINEMAAVANGEFLFSFNDDATIDTPSWEALLEEHSGKVGIIGPFFRGNEGGPTQNLFPIIHRKIIEVQGYYSLHEATDTHYDYWCSILRGLGYELRIEDDRISTTHVPLGGEHVRDDLFSDPGGVKNYIDKITADAVRLINYFGGELNASR
tara:strand:- start:3455 stop:4294 length:840 start_codon:yes stop_codon:yes gene_type:complete